MEGRRDHRRRPAQKRTATRVPSAPPALSARRPRARGAPRLPRSRYGPPRIRRRTAPLPPGHPGLRRRHLGARPGTGPRRRRRAGERGDVVAHPPLTGTDGRHVPDRQRDEDVHLGGRPATRRRGESPARRSPRPVPAGSGPRRRHHHRSADPGPHLGAVRLHRGPPRPGGPHRSGSPGAVGDVGPVPLLDPGGAGGRCERPGQRPLVPAGVPAGGTPTRTTSWPERSSRRSPAAPTRRR